MSQRTVGFIGLGQMGLAMARNLAKAGVALVVFDVRPEPLEALATHGARSAASPAELARQVDLLFVCVPSETEAEAVFFGDGGVSEGRAGNLAIVDTTTMNHGSALRLCEQATSAGLVYSDCPVSGKPFRAEDGTLTMMFGGTRDQFAAARPYLDIMGEFVVHCGVVGMGQLMKAVNNVIYDVNIAALCEVMPLAVKAGLDPETLEQVLTTASARSFASEYFVPRILDREFEGDFSLRAAYKDIVNVQELAERLEASLPVVEAMVSTYRTAIDEGFGDQPKNAMVKVYEARMKQEVCR
jgi:3-hydroxyisobutyrate dehydrogenase-like beta-hydroxyacid dehydrogenase